MRYEKLFSPCRIGTLEIKNRFVVPAMGTNYGDESGRVTQQLIDYYVERAKGGFGLIIIEVCAVDPDGRAIPNQINIWEDSAIPDMKRLIDELHRYGAKVAIQLHHAGRQTDPAVLNGRSPAAPYAIPCPVRKTLPRELSTSEVYELIDKFVAAGRRAYLAGADAVELNAAHGYLIAQFMSQYSNKRTDEFGGSLEDRLRFPIEIIRGIRQFSGAGFPIIVRYCADEMIEGGRRLQDSEIIAQILEQEGVSALSISMAVYGSLQYMSAPSAVPTGYITGLSKAIKEVVDIPVIVAGRINNAPLAESIVRTGKADFVALGRVSLADPCFPGKTAGGRTEEIAPCVGCLQGCLGYLFDPEIKKISCLINPFAGKEGEWKLRPAENKKKIVVVGAGPSGLEFSRIAAQRGHQVVCFEQSEKAGGQLRLAGVPPMKEDFLTAVKYLYHMAKQSGVTFRMGQEADVDLILREQPDAVVLATGSRPLVPSIKGIENPKIIHANALLEGSCMAGRKVLVAGGGMVGAETADYLTQRGCEVTIVEYKPEIAMDEQVYARMFLMERLKASGVVMITDAKITEFFEDGITYEHTSVANGVASSRVGHLRGFDSVVLALGSRAYRPLEQPLKTLCSEVYVIGDAVKAGKAITAIAGAAESALHI